MSYETGGCFSTANDIGSFYGLDNVPDEPKEMNLFYSDYLTAFVYLGLKAVLQNHVPANGRSYPG